jgi:hypothetical protein
MILSSAYPQNKMLRNLIMEDEATATLAIRLQLDDLSELELIDKGKGNADNLSDAAIARQLVQDELLQTQTFINDLRMTRSIGSAVLSDGLILSDYELQERLTAAEQQLQRRGIDSPAILRVHDQRNNPEIDDTTLSQLCSRYVAQPESSNQKVISGNGTGEASSSSQGGNSRKRPLQELCGVCNELQPVAHLSRLLCGHIYCYQCLQQLYETCTKDEQLYPPRCCRQIIVTRSIRHLLHADLLCRFEEKSQEYESKDRTYCVSPTCSKFIHPREIVKSQATCGACGTITCSRCKGTFHQGECVQDPGEKVVLDTAQQHGWQRCYACRNVVELAYGCHHMT